MSSSRTVYIVIGLTHLSVLMTKHIRLQSWAEVTHLEIQQHNSLSTKRNLSLVAFFFFYVISVLVPVPFIFFSATTQEPSIPLTILWQIPPASCCIYRLVLCKLLALAFVCLAGISKHLPIISLICPALFSHDCSVWAFFPGSSRFPTRPSLIKLPLEPFQIPLRDKVYLSSA